MFAYRRKKRSNIFAIPVKTRRRRIQVSWRAWFWMAAIILALAGLLYLAFWSPVFKVKKWSVEGVNFTATAQAQELVSQLLQTKIWKVIPGDSLVVFFGRETTRWILTSFPEAESVKINKDILKGIKIIIRGRQPAAIWCQSLAVSVAADSQATSTESFGALPQREKCFFADSSGLLFRAAPEISGTALPTFFSQEDEDFGLRSQTVASSTIQFASQLKKQLRERGVHTLGFRADAAGSQDLTVFVDSGWVIYFNMDRSLLTQVKILGALLSGDLKDKTAELKYIDLRVAGKVYYK
ncbi:hypothetical protein KKF25_03120 [Patescibacteria group bacterium]|nr:hypothetical protein [Patescibacteria group bacterium]